MSEEIDGIDKGDFIFICTCMDKLTIEFEEAGEFRHIAIRSSQVDIFGELFKGGIYFIKGGGGSNTKLVSDFSKGQAVEMEIGDSFRIWFIM